MIIYRGTNDTNGQLFTSLFRDKLSLQGARIPYAHPLHMKWFKHLICCAPHWCASSFGWVWSLNRCILVWFVFPQSKRFLRILFFAREHHDQNEIHSASFKTSQEEAGISSLFFNLLPTNNNPISFVVSRLCFQHTQVNISRLFGRSIAYDLPGNATYRGR